MKDKKSSYSIKIGNTTFIVCVKQSESAKKGLTVFQDICKHEALGHFFAGKSFNLENSQKVSWQTRSRWCQLHKCFCQSTLFRRLPLQRSGKAAALFCGKVGGTFPLDKIFSAKSAKRYLQNADYIV